MELIKEGKNGVAWFAGIKDYFSRWRAWSGLEWYIVTQQMFIELAVKTVWAKVKESKPKYSRYIERAFTGEVVGEKGYIVRTGKAVF